MIINLLSSTLERLDKMLIKFTQDQHLFLTSVITIDNTITEQEKFIQEIFIHKISIDSTLTNTIDIANIYTYNTSTVETYNNFYFILTNILISREVAKKLIINGYVAINDNIESIPHKIVKPNDKITIYCQKFLNDQHNRANAIVSTMTTSWPTIPFLYEDEYIVVIDKPTNLSVHNGAGTVISAQEILRQQYHNIEYINRLDKQTSGIVLFAKNQRSKNLFSELFTNKQIEKEYSAICWYAPKQISGIIINKITRHRFERQKMAINELIGKEAITKYNVQRIYGLHCTIDQYYQSQNLRYTIPIASSIKCIPITGRTHQLRLHLSSIGCTIINDNVYGSQNIPQLQKIKQIPEYDKETFNDVYDDSVPLIYRASSQNSYALHAYQIKFIHPYTNNQITVTSPIPNRMLQIQNYLETI